MSDLLFGLNITTSAAGDADPLSDARRAEELGFDFLSVNDHLHGIQPTNETWTLLSWMAAATARIRVATRVLGVPYRNPAVVAKMAESLDRLSAGRLILGLGAGASDDEFRAFGLGMRSPRDKVDGMEEAIRIIRGLWSESRFSFDGHFYRTDQAELEPKSQRNIPIWLGTYGNRALAVTGRLADGWIPSLEMAPPDRVTIMRNRVLDAALKAGRDPSEITCVYNMEIRVDDRGSAEPFLVSGPAEVVAERLIGFAAMGFGAMNFIVAGAGKAEQTERLARDVIPAVRAA